MELWSSFVQLGLAMITFLSSLVGALLPWAGWAVWAAYWYWLVDWRHFRAILSDGGWILVFIGAAAVALAWTMIDPRPPLPDAVYGLKISSVVSKFAYVTLLVVIAGLAGSVQLAQRGWQAQASMLNSTPKS